MSHRESLLPGPDSEHRIPTMFEYSSPASWRPIFVSFVGASTSDPINAVSCRGPWCHNEHARNSLKKVGSGNTPLSHHGHEQHDSFRRVDISPALGKYVITHSLKPPQLYTQSTTYPNHLRKPSPTNTDHAPLTSLSDYSGPLHTQRPRRRLLQRLQMPQQALGRSRQCCHGSGLQ